MSNRISGYRDEDTIQQIVDAARAIEEFCQGMTFDEFTRDLKTQSAIQYQVLVIGEAAYRLTDPFLAATPDIPWRDIKQMRNVLAHAYDIIRLDIVWQTATESVPTLLTVLQAIPPSTIEAPNHGDETVYMP